MTSCYLELFLFLKVPKATKGKYTFNAKILYKRILHVTTVTKAIFPVENTYFPYLTNITSIYLLFLHVLVISWAAVRVICIFLLCYSIVAWGELETLVNINEIIWDMEQRTNFCCLGSNITPH